MDEKNRLQQAINTIRDFVEKRAAYHYTIRVEFTRFMPNDTRVEIKVEGPDGDELEFHAIPDRGEELLDIIEACEISMLDADERSEMYDEENQDEWNHWANDDVGGEG